MPRKQRFKPSRKPQNQPRPAGEQSEQRPVEVRPDDVDIEEGTPSRPSSESDVEGGRH
jgi:hypothetical protein